MDVTHRQIDRTFINNSFKYLQNNIHSTLEYMVQIVFELFCAELIRQNYSPQCAMCCAHLIVYGGL